MGEFRPERKTTILEMAGRPAVLTISAYLDEFSKLCVPIWCPERAFDELSLGTKSGVTKIKTRGERYDLVSRIHALSDR